MTGVSLILVLAGLGVALGALVIARTHWFALIDIMHRLPSDTLARLDWPPEPPLTLGRTPTGFPVRRLRLRVLLRGMPDAVLCPPAALNHARAFRLWAAALLAGLGCAGALIAPVASIAIAGLALAGYLLARPWPARSGDQA